MARPATLTPLPLKKYSERFVFGPTRGNDQRAFAASLIVQIATSASACAAHDFGGGGGATAPP